MHSNLKKSIEKGQIQVPGCIINYSIYKGKKFLSLLKTVFREEGKHNVSLEQRKTLSCFSFGLEMRWDEMTAMLWGHVTLKWLLVHGAAGGTWKWIQVFFQLALTQMLNIATILEAELFHLPEKDFPLW